MLKPKMIENIYTGVLIFLTVGLLVFFWAFVFQRSLYLMSTYMRYGRREKGREQKIPLRAADNIALDFYFIDNNSDVDCIVVFGNVVNNSFSSYVTNWLADNEIYNVFYYNLRGKIKNPGVASEKGILKDVKAIGDFLNGRRTKKVGYGFSFGCSVVLRIFKNLKDTSIVVLTNPFSSFSSVAKDFFFGRLFSFMIVNEWDNLKLVRELNCKIDIVTSKEDQIVNPRHSEKLKAANSKIKHTVAPVGGHNAMVDDEIIRGFVLPLIRRGLQEIK